VQIAHHGAKIGAADFMIERFFLKVFKVMLIGVRVNRLEVVFFFIDDLLFEQTCTWSKTVGLNASLVLCCCFRLDFGSRCLVLFLIFDRELRWRLFGFRRLFCNNLG
jgi:hypothetical protein